MRRPDSKFEKYWYAGITGFAVITTAIVVATIFANLGAIGGVLTAVNSVMLPVYIGIIIAYLLSPLVNKMDRYVFIPLMKKVVKKKHKAEGMARAFSVITVLILALVVIGGILVLVVPEVVNSISRLISSLPGYYTNLKEWGNNVFKSNPTWAKHFQDLCKMAYEKLLAWLQNDLLPNSTMLLEILRDGLLNAFNVLFNIFIGFIISIYMLTGKENFCAQGKKMMYTVFSVKRANGMISVLRETHEVFAKFISGKILDSLVVGVLTFIVMSIAGIPYTVLISVLIGVTNVIPFFGQYLGIIPSALLVFIADPGKGVIFLILIIVLMQFDGNVLGPKILGDSIGLKSFWILFSIIVFGGLFGLLGMLCAVPVFAIIYRTIKRWSSGRLARKKIPTETDFYCDIKELEPAEQEHEEDAGEE